MKVPKIRFQGYNEAYKSVPLSEITTKIKRKNKNNETNIPLTISSQEGLIDQRTYFDKPIASKDMTGYFLLHKGEFAYNKSYSKGFPIGSIKRLDNYDKGALSTLYICFSLNENSNIYPDYLKQYFNSTAWYKSVKPICAEGARNHGLLNVSPDDFFNTIHSLSTNMEEQKKIAQFLNLFDKKIENQRNRCNALLKQREGILTNIFNGKIRFKKDDGTKYKDWEEKYLNQILIERKEKSTGNEEVYSVSVSKGLVNQIEHLGRSFAAEDTSNYKIIRPGDIVYTKSPTGSFKWGIVKQSMIDKPVIISPLYGIFIPENDYIGFVLDAYFSSSIRAHNYLITQVRKGAKNTINITNDMFLNKKILLPVEKEEACKIKKFIQLLDEKINLSNQKLETLITIKNGFLQKLFI